MWLKACSQHMNWTDLNYTEYWPETSRPSYTTRSSGTRVSITTSFAAAKLGWLVLSHLWTQVGLECGLSQWRSRTGVQSGSCAVNTSTGIHAFRTEIQFSSVQFMCYQQTLKPCSYRFRCRSAPCGILRCCFRRNMLQYVATCPKCVAQILHTEKFAHDVRNRFLQSICGITAQLTARYFR